MGAIAEGFVAYAQPLLDQTDGSLEQMKKAFAIAQFCFNLSLTSEGQREEMLKGLQESFSMGDEEFADFRRSIIAPMVDRHEELFGGMPDVDLADPFQSAPKSRPRVELAEPVERQTTTDRYAPCPCNSGKKYKFCCGMKGRS
jgi:hypothetical protein